MSSLVTVKICTDRETCTGRGSHCFTRSEQAVICNALVSGHERINVLWMTMPISPQVALAVYNWRTRDSQDVLLAR
jgi:hypothetical protein